MPPRADAALAAAARALAEAGVAQPWREARLLLAHAQGRHGLPDLAGADLAGDVPERFAELVARRAGREPMALITGRRGFWTLDLDVSAATLIPRPESETLVEAALAAFPDRARVGRVLDLGTGTGALLLAVLTEFTAARGVGVDRAEAACRLARDNAARAGLLDRAWFVCGDWAAPLAGRFDLILANPPYVARAELPLLMPEVAAFEPASALDGGPDGLASYRALLTQLPALLAEQGLAVLEVGAGQAQDVESLAEAAGLLPAGRRNDLSGIARAVMLRGQKTFGRQSGKD